MSLETYLTSLRQVATAADDAEKAYRLEAEARTRALAAARAEAYRRVNFLTTLADLVSRAPDGEGAIRNARAHLCVRLGWDEMTPARQEVLDHFDAVALAIHAALNGVSDEADRALGEAAPADAPAAMEAFELWYASTRESTFWYLFEHYMPETPVVDF